MMDKPGKILARRAIYVVVAFIIVSVCPSQYNEYEFYDVLGGLTTTILVFVRAFMLVPLLVLLISYLVCGAIGFGLDIKRRPGKTLTIVSLAIAAAMLLGGLYISSYFLLVGGSLILPKPLEFLWQDPGPLYMWWAVAGIFVHIGITNISLLRTPRPGNDITQASLNPDF